MPETAGDPDRAGRLLDRLLRLEIPAFVMRRAGIRHRDGQPLSQGLINTQLPVGNCMGVFTLETCPEDDFGPHADRPHSNAPAGSRLTNFHTTSRGSALVSVMPLATMNRQLISPLRGAEGRTYQAHLRRYNNGIVDSSIIVPQCYQAVVEADDTVVLLDWQTLHDFVSLSDPRGISSGEYPVYPADIAAA